MSWEKVETLGRKWFSYDCNLTLENFLGSFFLLFLLAFHSKGLGIVIFLMSNLDYLDLNYLDFSILLSWLASLVPVFHEYLLLSVIFCVHSKTSFPSNYVMKLCCSQNLLHFKAQSWTCFFFKSTVTNTLHFTKVRVAEICSIAEQNFIYSSLSYSVLFLLH